jgi:dipeptidyl aminopeptidase/acylaminoacyl peptidase
MFKRSLAFVAVTLLLAFNAFAQAKRPITHEDVWLMKRVGAPVPSPDGKWVVFSVVEPAYDEKEQVSDLWIVPADGSAKPRKLTNTKGGESGAAWSPDSMRIVFAARREGDEANQLYVLDVVSGGEAMRVTTLSTGARSPQFSPDGKWLLFQSSVYPGAPDDAANQKIAAERKARKYNARVYEGFPIRNWDRWIDEKQTHVFVQTLEPGAKAKDLLAGTRLVSEPGFAGAPTSGSDDLQAVWTPDGAAIIFTAMDERHRSAYAETHTRLYRVTVSNSAVMQLTPDGNSDGFTITASRPRFSPDGKALYCIVELSKDKTYNLERLARLEWPLREERQPDGHTIKSADFRIITPNFDHSIASFDISPDGRTVYLTAEGWMHEDCYAVAAHGGEVKPVLQNLGTHTNLIVPSKASSTILLANWESTVNPPEIVRFGVRPDGAPDKLVRLTNFNAERVAQIDWQPAQDWRMTSSRGRTLHNMLVLPPNFDPNKKYPLFVVIHGGPHSMWRDQFVLRWNYHLLAAPGYVVLLTNYTGSTGFGEKFAQAIQGDPLKTPGDEINEAADEAIKRFKFIDASRQAAGGASYGGHLANWLQATTTRYKCLISHAGLVNLESQWATSDTIYSRERTNGGPVWEQGEIWRKQNPIRFAAQFKTPMLLSVGEIDFRVPMNNTLENWSVLQRLRIPSKLLIFPEENHWVMKGENSRFWYSEVHAWLAKWLNGGQS